MIAQSGIRAATRLDIPAVNLILNHRDVRPTIGIGIDGPIDVSDSFGNYVVLMFSRSMFMVETIDPGAVEVHVAVVPEDRGMCAIEAAQEAIGRIFLNTPTTVFLAKTRVSAPEAGAFSIATGFHRIRIDQKWVYWAQHVEDWLARQNPEALAPAIQAGGFVEKFQLTYERLRHVFLERQPVQIEA